MDAADPRIDHLSSTHRPRHNQLHGTVLNEEISLTKMGEIPFISECGLFMPNDSCCCRCLGRSRSRVCRSRYRGHLATHQCLTPLCRYSGWGSSSILSHLFVLGFQPKSGSLSMTKCSDTGSQWVLFGMS